MLEKQTLQRGDVPCVETHMRGGLLDKRLEPLADLTPVDLGAETQVAGAISGMVLQFRGDDAQRTHRRLKRKPFHKRDHFGKRGSGEPEFLWRRCTKDHLDRLVVVFARDK
jgi:hypothetical protein